MQGRTFVFVILLAVAHVAVLSCGSRYRWVAPPGHTDTDISLDIAYCQEEKRGQFETVEPAACLQGRGWTLEPVP